MVILASWKSHMNFGNKLTSWGEVQISKKTHRRQKKAAIQSRMPMILRSFFGVILHKWPLNFFISLPRNRRKHWRSDRCKRHLKMTHSRPLSLSVRAEVSPFLSLLISICSGQQPKAKNRKPRLHIWTCLFTLPNGMRSTRRYPSFSIVSETEVGLTSNCE